LLRLYISTFAQTAIAAPDFKALYESFVNATFDNVTADNIIATTDWDTWVYGPGLPPVTLDFQTTELADARALAQAYADLGGESSPDDYMTFFDFFSSQQVAFVQELDAIDSVDANLLAYIDSELELTSILDPMVKTEWFIIGIANGYEAVIDPAYVWIGEQGRNAYVKPIFSAMVSAGKCDMAKTWFADYENFYNSYVVGGVSRKLVDCVEKVVTVTPTPAPETDKSSKASLPASFMFVWAAAMILSVNVL
jgi:leukotriene-A4 hydrolase